MKVLIPGRDKEGWTGQFECTGNRFCEITYKGNKKGCGAVLEVERCDLFITSSHDFASGDFEEVMFTCPECGKHTWIDFAENFKGNIPKKRISA